jgi:type III secretory pathway component EscS
MNLSKEHTNVICVFLQYSYAQKCTQLQEDQVLSHKYKTMCVRGAVSVHMWVCMYVHTYVMFFIL